MTKSRALLLSQIPAMPCCRQKRWRTFKNLRRWRARSDARSVRDASSVGPQSEQIGYAEMLGLGARSMVVGVEGPASPPLPQHSKIGDSTSLLTNFRRVPWCGRNLNDLAEPQTLS